MNHLSTLSITAITLMLLASPALGQWTSPAGPTTYTFDEVGIGTTTLDPSTLLHIVANASEFPAVAGMRIQNSNTGSSPHNMVFSLKNEQSGVDWLVSSLGNQPNQVGQFTVSNLGVGIWLAIEPTGNVGIGTTTPQHKLDVSGTGQFAGKLTLTGAGDALLFGGSGVQNLRLTNDNIVNANNLSFNDTGINEGIDWKLGRNIAVYENGQGGHRAFQFNTSASYPFVFNGGNVGIGTTNPQSELAVDGTITAREIEVTVTGWADHVFTDDHELLSLADLEKAIDEHGHLPGIPSQDEALAGGVRLGDMQVKLLEKIEELTLYMIDLEKRNQGVAKENQQLRERMARLESTVTGGAR